MKDLTTALTDAQTRLAQIRADRDALMHEAIAINQRGVELEKAELLAQGEVKALEGLRDGGE